MTVKSIKISNVSETFKIFFYYAKINGFAIFSPKEKILKGKIEIKLIDILLILSFLIVYIGTTFYLLQFKFKIIDDDSSLIESFGLLATLTGTFSNVLVSTIFCFIFRHQLWSIMKSFHIVDDQIKQIGTTIDYNKHALLVICFIVFGEVILNAITFLLARNNITMYLRIYVPNHGFLVLMSSVVLILLAIFVRLKALNKTFKIKFLPIKNWISERELKYLVSHFGKIYGALNDCLDLINFFFGFQTLLYTSLYMMFTVFSIFSVYRGLNVPDKGAFEEILFYVSLESFYSVFIFAVIYFGNKIQNEVC